MLSVIDSSDALFGLAAGIPVAVMTLAVIWWKPRRLAPLWGALSVVIVAGVLIVAWSTLQGFGESSQGAAALAPPPPSGPPPGPGGLGPVTGPPPTPPSPTAAACSRSGSTVDVIAKNISFDSKCLAAPAGKPFKIDFRNDDGGTPHNFSIYTDQSAAQSLFSGDIITGPDSTTYKVSPLQPGTYFFRCDVHPTQMNGTFIAS